MSGTNGERPSLGNCIHSASGLCEQCKEDYDADPIAWIEFGNHPDGLAAYKRLQDELNAFRAANPPVGEPDPDIPF